MPRSPRVQAILRLALCLILVRQAGWAKPAADPLAPTRAALDSLQSCLGASPALSTLRKGLLWGWPRPGAPPTLHESAPAPPPPPEYLESLEVDGKACQAAAAIQNEEQRGAALGTIRKDIEIKADDCHKFGMGRKVPLVIRTVRADKVESGWEVFYKWSCASLLQPQEVRVPQLTSPASVELPPGVYSVRAQKKDATNQVRTISPVTVVVGSAQWVPLELAVP